MSLMWSKICGHQCSKLRGYECVACSEPDTRRTKKEQVAACSKKVPVTLKKNKE